MDITPILSIVSALRGEQGQQAMLEAEHTFARISGQTGVSSTLLHILLTPQQYDEQTRVFVSILLKKLVVMHWTHESNAAAGGDDDDEIAALLTDQHREYAATMEALNKQAIEISQEDKSYLRQHIFPLLGESNRTIRSNVTAIVAEIGTHDFPQHWPDLIQVLLQAVASDNVNAVLGGLSTLTTLLDISVDTIIQNAPISAAVFEIITRQKSPEMLQQEQQAAGHPFISQFAYSSDIRSSALTLYHTLVRSFSIIDDCGDANFEKTYSGPLQPHMAQMVQACLLTIAAPLPSLQQQLLASNQGPYPDMLSHCLPVVAHAYKLTSPASLQALQDVYAFEARGNAIKTLSRLVAFFPKTLKAVFDVKETLLTQVGLAYQAIGPVYEHNNIFSVGLAQQNASNQDIPFLCSIPESFCVESNSSSPLNGLSFFCNCITSLLHGFADQVRIFPKFLLGKLDLFLPTMCRLSQHTAMDTDAYQYDINLFIVNEDALHYDQSELLVDLEHGSSVRNECSAFIFLALDKWNIKASLIVLDAILSLWARGEQLFASMSNAANASALVLALHWWKPKEAALLLIGRLMTSERSLTLPAVQKTLPMQAIVESYLYPSLSLTISSQNSDVTYLQARAAWLLSPAIRHLTTQLTTQLHREKNISTASQTYNNIISLFQLLPLGLGLEIDCTPNAHNVMLQTKIATLYSISQCVTSILAIDHSYLLHSCQNIIAQFHTAHPDIQQEYEYCMTQHIPIPIHYEFVNSIDVTFTSVFARYMPVFLQTFYVILPHVSDEGMLCTLRCFSWTLDLILRWKDMIYDLAEQFPYIKFTSTPIFKPGAMPSTPPPPNSPVSLQALPVITKTPILPSLVPFTTCLTPTLMSQLTPALLQAWHNNQTNLEIAHDVVDLFRSFTQLSSDLVHAMAQSAYKPILMILNQKNDTANQLTKLHGLGFLSIVLRALSPGIASDSLNALDQDSPSSQSLIVDNIANLPKITSTDAILSTIQTFRAPFVAQYVSDLIPLSEICDVILPMIFQLATTATEKSLIFGTCALTSSLIAMYGSRLVEYFTQRNGFPELVRMILTMTSLLIVPFNNPSDLSKAPEKAVLTNQLGLVEQRDALVPCRIFIQLLLQWQHVLPQDQWCDILRQVVIQVATNPDHAVALNSCYVLLRVGIQFPRALLEFIHQMPTLSLPKYEESTIRLKKSNRFKTVVKFVGYDTVQAFDHTLNVLTQHFSTTSSVYVQRVAAAFLTLMLNDSACLELLAGRVFTTTATEYPAEPAQGTTSKSIFQAKKAAAAPVTRTVTSPLIAQMLSFLCTIGARAVAAAKQKKHLLETVNQDDADGFESLVEDGADESEQLDQDVNVNNMNNLLFGQNNNDGTVNLSDLMDLTANELDGGDDDDDTQADIVDFPEAAYDVLYNIDIASIVSQFTVQQHNSPSNLFAQFAQSLGPDDQTAYNTLLQWASQPN